MALICWKKNYVVNFCFGLVFPLSFCLETKIISLLSAEKKKHKCRKDESRMGIVIFALLRFRN